MIPTNSTLAIRTTRTGVTELRRRWRAPDPWASALIVHGLAEHSGRYELSGSFLASAGVDTHSFDLLGFGASGGRRADTECWSTYLLQVVDNLAPLFTRNLPVLLVGHSIGGLIVVDYALSRYRRPDLVVLNAPAIDAVVPQWQRVGAPLLARVAPRLTLANPIYPEEIFIDPEMARDYRSDPLMFTRTSARLGDLILRTMDRVRRSLDVYTLPTLVLHGEADTLVPTEVSAGLERLPNVERRVYPGIRHGSINEPEGIRMLEDLTAWARHRVDGGDRAPEGRTPGGGSGGPVASKAGPEEPRNLVHE